MTINVGPKDDLSDPHATAIFQATYEKIMRNKATDVNFKRQALIDSYARAFKLGYLIDTNHNKPGLVFESDKYSVKIPYQCNLLETVLIGAKDCTGDWLFDAAIRLNTSKTFLEGFITGLNFKITPEDKPS